MASATLFQLNLAEEFAGEESGDERRECAKSG
jgi:hypothetical protein